MGADPNDSEGLLARGPSGTAFLKTAAKAVAGLLAALALIALFAVLFRQALGGQSLGADYYIYWNAGRALLQHQDPYGPETALSTQLAVNRRASLPGEDPLHFNFPLYALLAVWPTLGLDFNWAQPVWMAANLVLLLGCTVLGFRKPQPWLLASLPFVYNFAYSILLGNLCLPAAAILLFCCGYFILHSGKSAAVQILAGVLLAWCTVKPQYSWAYLAFLLLFAWRRRYFPLLIAFAGGWFFFIAGSFLVMPGWLTAWMGMLLDYTKTFAGVRSLDHVAALLFPPSLVRPGGYAILAAAVLAVVWKLRAWWQQRIPPYELLAWLSILTFLIQPHNQSSDQTIFFLPVILWISGPNRPRLGWAVWAGLFASSYAGFFLSQAGLFPAGVQVLVFLAFLAWVAGIEIYGVSRRRALSGNNP